jgi:small subunit ribosomal protein S27Ae
MAGKVEKTGKRARKKKPTSKKYKMYKISGDKVTRAKSCPRCGPGIFLMDAGTRLYCGKCHMTEFTAKGK